MRIRVEECWNGGETFSLRVTILTGMYAGSREIFYCSDAGYTREEASRIRDRLVSLYGAKRQSIRVV